MKKKIAAVLLLSTLIAGTVSASTINGDYKGNPIVKVRANGILLDPEVPAQIIDGKTMLPLRDVAAALGTELKWDQNTYSVDINSSQKITLKQVVSAYRDYGLRFIIQSSDGNDNDVIDFNISGTVDNLIARSNEFVSIIQTGLLFNADVFQITDEFGDIVYIPAKAFHDLDNGLITQDQFSAQYKFIRKSSSSNQTSSNTTIQTSGTNNNQSSSGDCEYLRKQYVTERSNLERNLSPFSGSSKTKMEEFETNAEQIFNKAGCTKPNY